MRLIKQLLLPFMLFLLLGTTVTARQGHLTLLAVQESGTEQLGATADLDLEITSGNGKVFLNTIPLTKIDTQISTRFAKDIACDYLELDCSKYDFFYTIRADSPIIGGPSAGAAISALTVFLLKDLKYDENILITGTINSGGIVGPIGGLQAKIEAASKIKGVKEVLIPKGERYIKQANKTIDAVAYGKNLSVNVLEVATLGDVVYQFTGKRVKEEQYNLSIDPNYIKTMQRLAEELCNRTRILSHDVDKAADVSFKLGNEYKTRVDQAKNLSSRGSAAIDNSYYYSAASYCFGANVKYQQLLQKAMLKDKLQVLSQISSVEQNISKMQNEVRQKELKTITDLQAYIVVSERLNEAREQLELAARENNSQDGVAYAIERLYSAKSWANFFGQKGKEYVFNEKILRDACLTKIAEAEESYQYVTLYFPGLLQATQQDISDAYKFAENKQYALCLSKASNAKANANSVLGVIGVDEEHISTVIDEKLLIGKQLIIRQARENSFPILGYSYWEYASSLQQYDKYSSLLYVEYSLELSNLDIYFEKKQQGFSIEIDPIVYWVFSSGLFIGIFVGWTVTKHFYRKKSLKVKRQSRRR
jgi:uncharacterized protein